MPYVRRILHPSCTFLKIIFNFRFFAATELFLFETLSIVTRLRLFFGKLMGNVLHADQYARAACDSISRTVVMLSAVGTAALNWAIAPAVAESSSLLRATCS